MASSGRPETQFPGAKVFRSFSKLPLPPLDEKHVETKVSEVPKMTTSMTDRREALRLNSSVRSDKEDSISIVEGSPWNYYEWVYSIELGGSVERVFKIPDAKLDKPARKVRRASKVPENQNIFTMRVILGPDADEKLNLLRHLKRDNILTTYEVFSDNNEFYVISEDAELSLNEFIVVRPDEVQLAAIVGQVTVNAPS
jgi:hypothetical protein